MRQLKKFKAFVLTSFLILERLGFPVLGTGKKKYRGLGGEAESGRGWVVQFLATLRGWVILFYNIDGHTFKS